MKVLITGVAGLLGNHLARHLLSRGHEVVGVDNLSGGYIEYLPDCRFYARDVADTYWFNLIVERERPEVVYHFAAYAAEGLSPFIRRYNYTNNVVGSANVVNACIRNDVRKLVFTSSMAVYGHGNPPFTEDQRPEPIDPYGIAKYAVEMDLKLAGEQFGLDYTIVRPHNVIGIYQNIWDRYRNVIGIWINQILSGSPITIYGDGTQRRAFSDVKFYLEPFERLLNDCPGETINIGADRDWSINEAADLLMDVASHLNPCKTHLEARHEVHTAYCDHTKAKEMLGFRDETDLKATMAEMLSWAESQPRREPRKMRYEVEKGLYSFWRGNTAPVHTATQAA